MFGNYYVKQGNLFLLHKAVFKSIKGTFHTRLCNWRKTFWTNRIFI